MAMTLLAKIDRPMAMMPVDNLSGVVMVYGTMNLAEIVRARHDDGDVATHSVAEVLDLQLGGIPSAGGAKRHMTHHDSQLLGHR